jgi:putative membrane protein
MQFFYWLIFLMAIGIAIFAVQNSSAAPVVIKFLIWRFQTSLVYTILGSIGLGILVTLLFWIPRALRASFRSKKSNQEVPPT